MNSPQGANTFWPTPTPNVVPAFKRQRNRDLTEVGNSFNHHVAGVTVGIENCIGLLKNWFQSLRGLQLRVSGKRDLIHVNAWILVRSMVMNIIGN